MARQKTSKKAEIEMRRTKLASLLAGGVTKQQALADALGVSIGTVNSDLKHLFAMWQREQVADVDRARALDLERADRLLRAVWVNATRGEPGAWDRALAILQWRAKVFGYTAPVRMEHSGADGGPIEFIEIVRPADASGD